MSVIMKPSKYYPLYGEHVTTKVKKSLKDLLSDYEYVRWNVDDKIDNEFIKKKDLKSKISKEDKKLLNDLLSNYKYLIWNADGSRNCKPYK